MATVAPTMTPTTGHTPRIIWADGVTGDTFTAYEVSGQHGLAASIQISGTFGGTTAKLQQSNDGTTFFDMVDLKGDAVSATSDAIFELSNSAAYLRPALTGGAANAVDFTLVLRG